MGNSIWSGAGSVDASLNNYVALHYASKHMSWLHCMWGIGATLGPYIMGMALTNGATWNWGYRIIFVLQIILTAILIFNLPRWKDNKEAKQKEIHSKKLSLKDIISIPRVKSVLICFFCYCGIEQTTMLWASSYLNLAKGVTVQTAASFAGMFCIGITIGRGINGFIAMKLKDCQMIRMGEVIIFVGIVVMLLPFGNVFSFLGFSLIGLGCAPIYPCIIHSTPEHFGAESFQAIIGVQMACAYIGTCLLPPFFGLIANHVAIQLLPVYLLILLVVMICMHEILER